MKKEKFKIIILEGTDKVGKSTIYQALNRASNYKYFVIDRLTASGIVYDEVYHRDNRSEEIKSLETELSNLNTAEVYLVYLFCDRHIQARRISQEDELSTDRLKNLDFANSLYIYYLQNICKYKHLMVNTTNKSVSETVQEIMSTIENYGNNNR